MNRYQKYRESFRRAAAKVAAHRKANSLCASCGAVPERGKTCDACKSRVTEYYSALKRQCFAAYGGASCACCGETEETFLSIDHVFGGGEKHRREIKRFGGSFYHWLVKEGLPPGYQVLCMNCQLGTAHGRICPHKKQFVKTSF